MRLIAEAIIICIIARIIAPVVASIVVVGTPIIAVLHEPSRIPEVGGTPGADIFGIVDEVIEINPTAHCNCEVNAELVLSSVIHGYGIIEASAVEVDSPFSICTNVVMLDGIIIRGGDHYSIEIVIMDLVISN